MLNLILNLPIFAEVAEKLDQNQNLKCVLRIVYYPHDLNYVPLFKRDPPTFDYLYAQCVSDFLHNEQILQIHATLEISIRLVSLRVQHLYLMLCSKHQARSANAVESVPSVEKADSSDQTTSQIDMNSNENNNNLNNPSNGQSNSSNSQSKPSTNKLFKNSTSFLFSGLRSSKTAPASKSSASKSTKVNAKSTALRLNAEQAFKDANKCVTKVSKEYGLDDFLPKFISDSIKHEELMKMLKYYFKKNQTDLLPEIVERFARQLYDGSKRVDCNDNNIGLKATSETASIFKTQPEISLKDVPINEDLIKLSFLALMSEIRSFGNVQFPTRAIALKYRDNDACDFDKKELYKCM